MLDPVLAHQALLCVTSGKGLSIGCQFYILLGTYYPRDTLA